MPTEFEILRDAGIEVKRWRGNHTRTICPDCNATRRKKNDLCLSVTKTSEAILAYCHHCGWAFGKSFDAQADFSASEGRKRARRALSQKYSATRRQASQGRSERTFPTRRRSGF